MRDGRFAEILPLCRYNGDRLSSSAGGFRYLAAVCISLHQVRPSIRKDTEFQLRARDGMPEVQGRSGTPADCAGLFNFKGAGWYVNDYASKSSSSSCFRSVKTPDSKTNDAEALQPRRTQKAAKLRLCCKIPTVNLDFDVQFLGTARQNRSTSSTSILRGAGSAARATPLARAYAVR